MPARRSGITARRRGNLMGLLHGVYPELTNEILRFAQNDKCEKFTMTYYECQPIYVVHYKYAMSSFVYQLFISP